MKRYLEYLIIFLISLFTVSIFKTNRPSVINGGSPSSFSCNTEDITNMYAGYVEDWKKQINKAFDQAEAKVFNVIPSPNIIGTHEDADKCICKGTGIIAQGDGHKTVCPYHGSKFEENVIIKPLIILEK